MIQLGRGLLALLLTASLTACATLPDDPDDRAEVEAVNDPLEPMNRKVFDFNTAIDGAVLQPVARSYRTIVPEPVQLAVNNVLNNLRSPFILANDVLQANPKRAGETLVRFMINSSAGLLGIFDIVGATGGPAFHSSDLGQTLGVWGVGEGPYLMLPFFGPSNPRDTVGLGVEWVADPTDLAFARHGLNWATWSRMGGGIVNDRAGLLDPLDDLKRSSLDFYAAVRSVYRQQRTHEISQGKQGSGL